MSTQANTRVDTRSLLRTARRIPINLLLIALSIAMIYPIVIIVITAFKPNLEVLTNPTGLPQAPTFDNFVTSWQDAGFANLFFNSVLLTVVSMTVATFVAALASYAIVRQATRIGSGVYLLLAAGIFLPMQLALVPQFRVVRDLGLINNYAGVILLYIAGALPFGVFLMAAFMRQVPKEIVEAAVIDGAGYFTLFRRIFLPLARPAIATFWVLQGVGVWNDYLVPQLLLTDPSKRTLTTGVLYFKAQYLADWGNIMAAVLIMSLPILLLFVFAQRFFVSGLYAGAVK
ncbi:raffinose/stachyose/melibiose transport system permease protein [Microbacterium sp. ru370.1]|uniref:carbohydrate ABC transporter permease n=1 Tax=unclassified Microbacterium TaxID=2609290 RepID=UPI00088D21FC|nr:MULTISPECIES: carbohydrate ABC transporter permease [unclassified Microbacterium]SDO41285.1 raffinose/stachyose/melibiose transport system permease protein [Microbacterium sp. ru370.1]SIT79795.1 raffinose/stachyose/melibiose transport system permease protein/N-acetylglucosamine transport system permease protein [Microbacterium sp. RU1D]